MKLAPVLLITAILAAVFGFGGIVESISGLAQALTLVSLMLFFLVLIIKRPEPV